ncbi:MULTISPECIES: alpha-L-fucosidase [Sphingobacterium]|uniref:alpha-L-fucosidase n=1 Tax=Sphingobacterium TaxID=28453 RepID=UPI0013DA1CDE|nr:MULTISPECIES: alpha-L-fucosidase [unclassified Sphingobacterium]
MNLLKHLLLAATLLFSFGFMAKAQQVDQQALRAFMEKRFGLFIHWGPVSLRGTEIGWSRGHQVPSADYDQLYKEFNPMLFNAEKIVAMAKSAGMRYLTITAKHHDGFCLWPSAFTDYDIASTPYKKDVIKALAKACKKVDIAFCIYYSVCDWYHPDYPIHRSGDKQLDPKSNMANYVQYMKNQLQELVTKYDPEMLWFDGAWESPWTESMGREVYSFLKELKPALIVNNRLGKEIAAVNNKKIDVSKMIGDFDTPEQVVGHYNLELPWESCFTLCKQWSWKANDEMKPLKHCLDIISKTAGGSGNLLLNIGPMPDGRVEARQQQRLLEIGKWMKTYGVALYGTTAGPYAPTEDYTTTRGEKTLYIHILNTAKTEVQLPAFTLGKVAKAQVIDGESVDVQVKGDSLLLNLPHQRKDTQNYVVALSLM